MKRTALVTGGSRGISATISKTLLEKGNDETAAAFTSETGIVRSLTQKGAHAGITANAVCPGYSTTEMIMGVPEKIHEAIMVQIPTGRRCVAFLASDDAQFINGSTISANGGQFFA